MLELMVVLVIVAILTTIGAPSFNTLLRKVRVQSASTSLMGAFNMARAEAIRTGKGITVCAVDNASVDPPVCGFNWVTGWAIFTDADNDGAIDPGELYRVGELSNRVVVGGGAPTMFLFDGRGRPVDAVNKLPLVPGNYVVDAENCNSGVDKQVTVNITSVGQTRMSGGLCP